MSYRKLGDLVKFISNKNTDGNATILFGINIDKFFMPSVANIIGVDLKKYKVVEKYQFACNRMHVGRDERLPISMSTFDYDFIVSPAYDVFEVITSDVLPEYLILWFRRKEFDRQCWFYTDADVRGGLHLDALKSIEIKVPSIEEQRQIVAQYHSIANKIKVNEQICEKLEATAQALYKHWFVDFEFPVSHCEDREASDEAIPALVAEERGLYTVATKQGYKSSGGKMVWNEELGKEIPKGWEVKNLSDISKIIMGQSPEGENYNVVGNGKIFYQGRTDFGFRIPEVRIFTTHSKKNAKKGDVLMSVRAPVGDLNVADKDCSIGRGISAISSKESSYIFYLMKDFKSHFDLSEGTGTIFSSITKDELFGLRVIYDEKVSKFFNENTQYIDNQIISISKQTQKLTQLQGLLLSRLAVGEEVGV